MIKTKAVLPPVPKSKKSLQADEDEDEDIDEVEMEEEMDEYEWNNSNDLAGSLGIDEADAAVIEKFMTAEPRKQVNLADLIMSKIAENEKSSTDDTPSSTSITAGAFKGYNEGPQLDPKIIEVYSKVGLLLSRYRSGKLPKAFKIIPNLSNWEEVLFLTNPSGWTAHATYQATRIFVSNLGSKMAQRFFNLFLLDRVRDDIAETKKLNYHLYLALKKSLYKPAAFFKGLLLPLCDVNIS